MVAFGSPQVPVLFHQTQRMTRLELVQTIGGAPFRLSALGTTIPVDVLGIPC